MEIKYCDNCGEKIRHCSTARRIIVNDGDFTTHYDIDLCVCCFHKLNTHIRRTVRRYKNGGVK
jgi:hypothetical protein